LGASPGECARVAARRPGRPGGAAVPSGASAGATGHARWRGRVGEEEEIGVYDRWGRLVIGGKEKRERLLGWLGCDCWVVGLGRLLLEVWACVSC
jgi:hypothetical protein